MRSGGGSGSSGGVAAAVQSSGWTAGPVTLVVLVSVAVSTLTSYATLRACGNPGLAPGHASLDGNLGARSASGTGGPVAYLLANNPSANATWSSLKVGQHDVVFLFNHAAPLPHFAHLHPRQLVLVGRMVIRGKYDKATILPRYKMFDNVILFITDLATALTAPPVLEQLRAITHYEVFERFSPFAEDIWADYTRTPFRQNGTEKRPVPSSGFLAYRYVRRYMPTHAPVLVGFTGEPGQVHDWKYEQRVYDLEGVVRL